MKIKTKVAKYEQVMALKRPKHKKPCKPSKLLNSLIQLIGATDLHETHFTYTTDEGFHNLTEPALILMNHSSFIDLEMIATIMKGRPYQIICTSDGFVGKEWLMRKIGCIPTQKFVRDVTLIRDMKYSFKNLKTSVLMYPEASYTFDGTETPLPKQLGKLFKMMDVPVVLIKTKGAFLRDPLYNCLQKRQVDVSAHVSILFTRDQIKELSCEELDSQLNEAFKYNHFEDQLQRQIKITEPFRADGLERILYHCFSCGHEGTLKGKGTHITCSNCHKEYELDELGRLVNVSNQEEVESIPDWYKKERALVLEEIQEGKYLLDCDVTIGMMVDYKAIYMVGDGHLTHDSKGFHLTGCDGKLDYTQSPIASYSVYSDYYWYELGDIICIGNLDTLYYCFPKQDGVVAKTRLAQEELFKMLKSN